MTTKELLEDIKTRSAELAKMCKHFRDINAEGTVEYAFRDGQAYTWENQVTWAEDMLEVFYPDNKKD